MVERLGDAIVFKRHVIERMLFEYGSMTTGKDSTHRAYRTSPPYWRSDWLAACRSARSRGCATTAQ